MTIRLFVGLTLPRELRRSLAGLASGLPNARWVPEENLHVTRRFIGDIDEGLADDIHLALCQIQAPAFDLAISGLGTFGRGRRTRALWAGAVETPELVHLQGKVEHAVAGCGLPPEKRNFAGHVTLARLKDPPLARLQAFVAGNNLFHATFRVDSFQLFSSILGHGDPVYRVEMDYPLVTA